MRTDSLAARIARRHGLDGGSLTAVHGQGSVNHVFLGGSRDDGFVIRFAVDDRHDVFAVEAWCMARASAVGIPVATVVADGQVDGVPYQVQTRIPGDNAALLPRRALPDDLWRTLGGYVRTIANIELSADAPDGLFSRFGRDLDAAWQSHLAYNLDELGRDDPLVPLGVYESGRRDSLRAHVAALVRTPLPQGLLHGDIALQNVLLDADGRPWLIDWGAATTGPVPHGELLHLSGLASSDGRPGAADLAAFADGAGIDLGVAEATLRHLAVLRALDLVRWARDQRPDLLDRYVGAGRAVLAHAASAPA